MSRVTFSDRTICIICIGTHRHCDTVHQVALIVWCCPLYMQLRTKHLIHSIFNRLNYLQWASRTTKAVKVQSLACWRTGTFVRTYVHMHIGIPVCVCVCEGSIHAHLLVQQEGLNLCWGGSRVVTQIVCHFPGNMRGGHWCTRNGIVCTSRPGGGNAATLDRKMNE